MIYAKQNPAFRIASLVFAILLTISSLPLTAAAAKTTAKAQAGVRIEEAYITNDDGVHATTGFLVYCEDMTPTALRYKVVNTQNEDEVITDSKWVVVTPLTKEEVTAGADSAADTDGNQQVQDLPAEPDYLVDFRRPDGDKMPSFLFASTLGKEAAGTLTPATQDKTTQYALAPHYEMYFYVETAENAGKDPIWTKALDAAEGYVFTLGRPQRVAVKLEQEEPSADENGKTTNKDKFKPSTSGALSVYFYAPENVRNLLSGLKTEKTELLNRYGYSELTLSVRYTFGTEKTLADKEVEKASYLEFPITAEQVGDVIAQTFSFEDESFRDCFADKTFNSYDIGGEKVEGTDETTPRKTVYNIDKTKTTLGVRVSFVLTATPKSDANGAVGEATVTHSMMTDSFYCGKNNSMLSDPNSIDAPTVVIGTYDKNTQKLPVYVTVSDGAKDASVWLACLYGRDMRIGIDVAVNGEEWHAAQVSQWYTDGSYMNGGMHTVDLSGEAMTEYAYVRIRAKLIMDTNGENDLESAWSASASFDMRPDEVVTAPGTTEPISYYTETDAKDILDKKPTCRLCGFCPSPYGICLFLWVGAALLIVVLIVLVILMIPKRKKCPRCDTSCEPNAPVCPECGFRFVGMMPEIEDDEPRRPVVPQKKMAAPKEDHGAWQTAFGIEPAETVQDDTSKAPQTDKTTDTVTSTPAEMPITLPAVTPEFMVELRRKMRETKAGNPQSYTAEELAYIKALREKAAQDKRLAAEKENAAKAAAAKAAAEAKAEAEARAAMEAKAAAEAAETAAEETTQATPAAPAQKKLNPEQLARIRALRASQMRTGTTTGGTAETKAEPLPELRRAHSAPREVKCPRCAALNAEGSAVCRVCKGPLSK